MSIKVYTDESLCRKCSFCRTVNRCVNPYCVGCLSCYFACPYEAKKIIEDRVESRRLIKITVDGVQCAVPENVTVKDALRLIGYNVGIYPDEGRVQAPCNLGGCWACMVIADGKPIRSCITGF
ncbi:MAG: 2Fe-2S iron-sulfur cluster-binding protein [Candidatus Bathyarchaeia archaeon]